MHHKESVKVKPTPKAAGKVFLWQLHRMVHSSCCCISSISKLLSTSFLLTRLCCCSKQHIPSHWYPAKSSSTAHHSPLRWNSRLSATYCSFTKNRLLSSWCLSQPALRGRNYLCSGSWEPQLQINFWYIVQNILQVVRCSYAVRRPPSPPEISKPKASPSWRTSFRCLL